jgi:protein TonB
MLLRFSLFLLFFPLFLQAQVTKKVTVKQTLGNIKEVFYVLVDDPKIKHGLYQKIDGTGALLLQGKYKQGQKDSVWVEHYLSTGAIFWQGSYHTGTKAGLWSYFDGSGKLEQQYNFSTGELGYFIESNREKRMKTYLLSDSSNVEPERPLIYIGGMPAVYDFIFKTMEYPAKARVAGVEGKVQVSFVVNAFGIAEDHQVLNKFGYGLEEEALRIIKALPNEWLPAIVNGQRVATRFQLTFNFTIN